MDVIDQPKVLELQATTLSCDVPPPYVTKETAQVAVVPVLPLKHRKKRKTASSKSKTKKQNNNKKKIRRKTPRSNSTPNYGNNGKARNSLEYLASLSRHLQKSWC